MNFICQECHMPNAAGYHPYLHCIIWKATHLDPEKVLAEYGYTRAEHQQAQA